jgi:hypothetical protein
MLVLDALLKAENQEVKELVAAYIEAISMRLIYSERQRSTCAFEGSGDLLDLISSSGKLGTALVVAARLDWKPGY